MFKKMLFMLLGGGFLLLGSAGIASSNGASLQGDPFGIVHDMVKDAQGSFDIQNTKLNGAVAGQSSLTLKISKKYKIARTLERLRQNIQPYLQWLVFLGLAIAVILLIWNGFLLVTNSAMGNGDPKTVKENIKNIVIGVLIMSGFVAIIKIVVAVLNMFFDT